MQAACLGRGLPGEYPGLRQVSGGATPFQRGGPVQPGAGDKRPGAEPGIDRRGLSEMVERLLGPAEQVAESAERPVQRSRTRPPWLPSEQEAAALLNDPAPKGKADFMWLLTLRRPTDKFE